MHYRLVYSPGVKPTLSVGAEVLGRSFPRRVRTSSSIHGGALSTWGLHDSYCKHSVQSLLKSLLQTQAVATLTISWIHGRKLCFPRCPLRPIIPGVSFSQYRIILSTF
jgi:hypothetical protein